MKIALINNGLHIGIHSVGEAYRHAFEEMGAEFVYLSSRSFPKTHLDTVNLTIHSYLSRIHFDAVIFIQPTYMYGDIMRCLMPMKERTKFYAINTEDPYSTSATFNMNVLFDRVFTNEKVVADSCAQMGYVYLPVAFDTFQNFRRSGTIKKFDVSMQLAYYGQRIQYKEALQSMSKLKTHIGGNISYPILKGLPMSLTGFTAPPGMIPRHKELELYSKSKFVFNPHREPNIMGVEYFSTQQKECAPFVPRAISPNPRFFDCLGAGAIPLCDSSRTECTKIIREAIGECCLSFELPTFKDVVADTYSMVELWEKYDAVRDDLMYYVREYHSYLNRARTVMTVIEGDLKCKEQ